jgi:hypothetical protein
MPIAWRIGRWPKRQRPDRSRHPTCACSVTTIRAQRGVTGRAHAGFEDSLRLDAGGLQESPGGAPGVEHGPPWFQPAPSDENRWVPSRRLGLREKPVAGLQAQPTRRKPLPHIVADLVATRTNGRTDRHDEIGRVAAELAPERANRQRRNVRRQPSPSGVHSGDRPRLRVRDEQRHTVCGLDSEADGSRSRHDDVGRFGSDRAISHEHVGAVNLPEPHQVRRRKIESFGHGVPPICAVTVCPGTQGPGSRREEVRGERRQQSTDQCPPSAHLHPLESPVRLRKRLSAVCHV